MIRRVLSQPGPSAMRYAALPPGTPVLGPVRVVFVSSDGTVIAQGHGHPVADSGGAPFLQTGLTNWGSVVAAGRLR